MKNFWMALLFLCSLTSCQNNVGEHNNLLFPPPENNSHSVWIDTPSGRKAVVQTRGGNMTTSFRYRFKPDQGKISLKGHFVDTGEECEVLIITKECPEKVYCEKI
ncbi:MAG: hypothetical protein V6Z89_03145 [Desulfobacter sp.]